MVIEKLIKTVQVKPILYKADEKYYKHAKKKGIVWKEVAAEVGESSKLLAQCCG